MMNIPKFICSILEPGRSSSEGTYYEELEVYVLKAGLRLQPQDAECRGLLCWPRRRIQGANSKLSNVYFERFGGI